MKYDLSFLFGKQYKCSKACSDLEEEQHGKLQDNIGSERYHEGEGDSITGVRIFENLNTKIRKTLYPNKIYLDISLTYNQLIEDNYVIKVHKYKGALYG